MAILQTGQLIQLRRNTPLYRQDNGLSKILYPTGEVLGRGQQVEIFRHDSDGQNRIMMVDGQLQSVAIVRHGSSPAEYKYSFILLGELGEPGDCMKLSMAASQIFKKLEPFYPPDPWKGSCWDMCGIVTDNVQFDLRLQDDRRRLKEKIEARIGHLVVSQANLYRDTHGNSLEGFSGEYYTPKILLEVLRHSIINALDFQIAVADITDPEE